MLAGVVGLAVEQLGLAEGGEQVAVGAAAGVGDAEGGEGLGVEAGEGLGVAFDAADLGLGGFAELGVWGGEAFVLGELVVAVVVLGVADVGGELLEHVVVGHVEALLEEGLAEGLVGEAGDEGFEGVVVLELGSELAEVDEGVGLLGPGEVYEGVGGGGVVGGDGEHLAEGHEGFAGEGDVVGRIAGPEGEGSAGAEADHVVSHGVGVFVGLFGVFFLVAGPLGVDVGWVWGVGGAASHVELSVVDDAPVGFEVYDHLDGAFEQPGGRGEVGLGEEEAGVLAVELAAVADIELLWAADGGDFVGEGLEVDDDGELFAVAEEEADESVAVGRVVGEEVGEGVAPAAEDDGRGGDGLDGDGPDHFEGLAEFFEVADEAGGDAFGGVGEDFEAVDAGVLPGLGLGQLEVAFDVEGFEFDGLGGDDRLVGAGRGEGEEGGEDCEEEVAGAHGGRRGLLGGLAGTVGAGGAVAGAAEGFVEAAEGVEAGSEGDVEDLQFCGDEQALGVGDAVVGDVVEEGGSEGFLEEAHGVVGVDADGFADGFGGERLEVALCDEAGDLLDLVEAAVVEGCGAVAGVALCMVGTGQFLGHAEEAGLEFEEDDVRAAVAVGGEVGFPLGEAGGFEAGGVSQRLGEQGALKEGLDEFLGKLELEEPGEGDGDDGVLGCIAVFDNLMRNGGPEGGEVAGVDANFGAAEQVGYPAALEEVELDLVVVVGAPHGGGLPADAGEAVGLEVWAVGVEGVHGAGC